MQNVEQELIEMYRSMQRAMVEADTSALDAILASEFHLVHMTGYYQPREEWLAHIQSGEMRYFTSREHAVEIKVSGASARLIGRNLVEANVWGAQGTWPLQLVIDFSKLSGRWQIMEAHASTY